LMVWAEYFAERWESRKPAVAAVRGMGAAATAPSYQTVRILQNILTTRRSG
jgi:hypothetical protein